MKSKRGNETPAVVPTTVIVCGGGKHRMMFIAAGHVRVETEAGEEMRATMLEGGGVQGRSVQLAGRSGPGGIGMRVNNVKTNINTHLQIMDDVPI